MKKEATKKPTMKRKRAKARGGRAVERAGGTARRDGTDDSARTKRREVGAKGDEGVGNEGGAGAAAAAAGGNPLLVLPEKERAQLFAWLRECPYDEAVLHVLKDEGIAEVSREQLSEFFLHEAEFHWERRIARAAVEANALVELVERSPVQFSSGILAALGQEAFRQVASGQAEPEAMGKMATLFLRARSDERAAQMQELKREKMRIEMEGEIEHALEKLAEEVERHPAAREAFEALRREICEGADGGNFEVSPAEERSSG